MLNIGEKIFIPKYGGGVVKDIKEKSFFEKIYEYAIIYLLVDDMIFYIPLERVCKYKVRYISCEDTLRKALKTIKDTPEKLEKNWSKRYRRNIKKIEEGDIFKMCEALRDLYFLKESDLLPRGEEKILERAEEMLVSEIMLSLNIEREEAYSLLRNFSE